jgi:hypothetical protein
MLSLIVRTYVNIVFLITLDDRTGGVMALHSVEIYSCKRRITILGSVVGRRQQLEAPQHHGDHQLGFHHGKVVPDAGLGAQGERQERQRVRAGVRYSIRKPVGVELAYILPPKPRVFMHCPYCDLHCQPLRDEKLSQLCILSGHSGDGWHNHEDPHHFVQNHPHLNRA